MLGGRGSLVYLICGLGPIEAENDVGRYFEFLPASHNINSMVNSRSRSPQPQNDERRRSRSPRRRREDDRPRKSTGGFKWKEKKKDEPNGEDGRRLERGYRDRDRERPRSPRREEKAAEIPVEVASEKPTEKKEKKEKKVKSMAITEEMIIVHINDRLGTKAAIPCLASDPISESISPPIPPANSTRTIQSSSRCSNWPRASRNHVEEAGREALQRCPYPSRLRSQ